MSIIYTLIARDDNYSEHGDNIHVLSEASNDSIGNFPQVTREVVLKQVTKDQKSIYQYQDKYTFHILNKDGYTYLCLSDASYSTPKAQAFLDDVRTSFCSKYSFEERELAISYSLNGFTNTILEKMEYYNRNRISPKLAKIKSEAGATLGIMQQNLETIMDRGDRIELLVKKANNVNIDSSNLQRRSSALKQQASHSTLKWVGFIGIVVIIVVYFAFVG